MDKAQARHARAMAKKIKGHAALIVTQMAVIEHLDGEDLTPVSLNVIIERFNELEYSWSGIQRVLADMLPELQQQYDAATAAAEQEGQHRREQYHQY